VSFQVINRFSQNDDPHWMNFGARQDPAGEWMLVVIDTRAAELKALKPVKEARWRHVVEKLVRLSETWIETRCSVANALRRVIRHLASAERREFLIYTFGEPFSALVEALSAPPMAPIAWETVPTSADAVSTGACGVAEQIVRSFREKLSAEPRLRAEWRLPETPGEGEAELTKWLSCVVESIKGFVKYALPLVAS
jgi:hypothetical protein